MIDFYFFFSSTKKKKKGVGNFQTFSVCTRHATRSSNTQRNLSQRARIRPRLAGYTLPPHAPTHWPTRFALPTSCSRWQALRALNPNKHGTMLAKKKKRIPLQRDTSFHSANNCHPKPANIQCKGTCWQRFSSRRAATPQRQLLLYDITQTHTNTRLHSISLVRLAQFHSHLIPAAQISRSVECGDRLDGKAGLQRGEQNDNLDGEHDCVLGFGEKK